MNLPKVIFALVISIVVLYLCVMLVTVQNTLQEIQKGNENKETYVPAICNWEFGHYIQSEYEKMWFDNAVEWGKAPCKRWKYDNNEEIANKWYNYSKTTLTSRPTISPDTFVSFIIYFTSFLSFILSI